MAKKEEEKPAEAPKEGAEGAPAEGEAPAEGAEGGGKKLTPKKIVLFIVAPLLLLGGTGAGLYFSGFLDKILAKEEAPVEGEHAAAEGEEGAEGQGAAPAGPAFLEIPDMIVNLSSTDNQTRYLRLKIQLELKSEADRAAVELVMPRVIDQFQTYLRELRVKDLKGSSGIYRLQMELLARVNQAAYPVEVQDVLFQEILIQ